MPGGRDVSMSGSVAYIYDGSFEGFLCCVYDSVYRREMPLSVTREEDAPMLLDQARFVVTDQARAALKLLKPRTLLFLLTILFRPGAKK